MIHVLRISINIICLKGYISDVGRSHLFWYLKRDPTQKANSLLPSLFRASCKNDHVCSAKPHNTHLGASWNYWIFSQFWNSFQNWNLLRLKKQQPALLQSTPSGTPTPIYEPLVYSHYSAIPSWVTVFLFVPQTHLHRLRALVPTMVFTEHVANKVLSLWNKTHKVRAGGFDAVKNGDYHDTAMRLIQINPAPIPNITSLLFLLLINI